MIIISVIYRAPSTTWTYRLWVHCKRQLYAKTQKSTNVKNLTKIVRFQQFPTLRCEFRSRRQREKALFWGFRLGSNPGWLHKWMQKLGRKREEERRVWKKREERKTEMGREGRRQDGTGNEKKGRYGKQERGRRKDKGRERNVSRGEMKGWRRVVFSRIWNN